jgi:hypothetical protein
MPLLVLDDDADEARVAFTVRDERGWLAVVGDRGIAIECGEVPRKFVGEIADELYEVADAHARWLAYRPKPQTAPGGARVAVDPWGTRDAFELPGEVVGTLDGAFVSVLGEEDDGHSPVRITSVPRDGQPTHRAVSYALPAPDTVVDLWETPWWRHPLEPADRVFAISLGWVDVAPYALAIDVDTGDVEVLGPDISRVEPHARRVRRAHSPRRDDPRAARGSRDGSCARRR